MTTTWYSLWRRFRRWFHRPTGPVGATEKYGAELHAMADTDRELVSIAAELDIDLLDPEQRSMAEDILLLRLVVAEDIDHFDGRIERLLDEWQPLWWEEQPTTVLPTFGAVHALIDETGEFAVVTR